MLREALERTDATLALGARQSAAVGIAIHKRAPDLPAARELVASVYDVARVTGKVAGRRLDARARRQRRARPARRMHAPAAAPLHDRLGPLATALVPTSPGNVPSGPPPPGVPPTAPGAKAPSGASPSELTAGVTPTLPAWPPPRLPPPRQDPLLKLAAWTDLSRLVPLPSGEPAPGYALATATVQAFCGSLLASPEGILAAHSIHHAYQGAPRPCRQYWGVEVFAPGGRPPAFVPHDRVPDGGRGLWMGQPQERELRATCLLVAEDALSALCAWELLPVMDQRRTVLASLGGATASVAGQRSLAMVWSFILAWADRAGEPPRLLDATRNRRRQDSRSTESEASRDLRVLAGPDIRYFRHEPRIGGQSWAQVLTDLRRVERAGLVLWRVDPTPRPVLTPAQAAAQKVKRQKLLASLEGDDARVGAGMGATLRPGQARSDRG